MAFDGVIEKDLQTLGIPESTAINDNDGRNPSVLQKFQKNVCYFPSAPVKAPVHSVLLTIETLTIRNVVCLFLNSCLEKSVMSLN